jgi:hypothetical protein
MKRRAFQFGGVATVSIGLSGCGWNDSYWHQKITLTVNTPDGLVSGSAVTSIEWTENRIFKDGAQWKLDYTGEAVVVEVTKGKYLFALLTTKRQASGGWQTLGHIGPQSLGLRVDEGNTFKKQDGKIIVPQELYPLLVVFNDINDPTSVLEVEATKLEDHFGFGVALKEITLEVTDDPVTTDQIEKKLLWFWKVSSRFKSSEYRKSHPDDSINSVGGGEFKQPYRKQESAQ